MITAILHKVFSPGSHMHLFFHQDLRHSVFMKLTRFNVKVHQVFSPPKICSLSQLEKWKILTNFLWFLTVRGCEVWPEPHFLTTLLSLGAFYSLSVFRNMVKLLTKRLLSRFFGLLFTLCLIMHFQKCVIPFIVYSWNFYCY